MDFLFINKFLMTVGSFWFGKDDADAFFKASLKFLNKNQAVLHYQDILGAAFSWIKWAIIKGLYNLTNTIFGLVSKAFDMKGLLKDAGLSNVNATFISGGLAVSLITLSLVWFGVKKIVMPEAAASTKKVMTNLIVSVALITGIGNFINTGLDLSQSVFTAAVNPDKQSLPMTVIKNNTADLTLLIDSNFKGKNDQLNGTNNLTEDNFKKTDLTTNINKDKLKEFRDDNKVKETDQVPVNFLKYKLDTDQNGKDVASDFTNSKWYNFMEKAYKPGYARFSTNTVVIMISLIALAVAALFMIYTIPSVIIQLAVARIVSVFVFATDLENGQKTKEVMLDISKSIMVIACTGIEFFVYTTILTFAGNTNLNPWIFAMAIVAGTVMLLVGSNAFLKYFGVDTAIHNNGNGLLKAAAFSMTAGKMAKGAGSHAVNAVQQGGKGLGKMKDKISNAAEQYADEHGIETKHPVFKAASRKIGEGMNSTAKGLGYVGTRKAGLAVDAAQLAGKGVSKGFNAVKEGVSSVAGKAAEGANNVKDSYVAGVGSATLKNIDNSAPETGTSETSSDGHGGVDINSSTTTQSTGSTGVTDTTTPEQVPNSTKEINDPNLSNVTSTPKINTSKPIQNGPTGSTQSSSQNTQSTGGNGSSNGATTKMPHTVASQPSSTTGTSGNNVSQLNNNKEIPKQETVGAGTGTSAPSTRESAPQLSENKGTDLQNISNTSNNTVPEINSTPITQSSASDTTATIQNVGQVENQSEVSSSVSQATMPINTQQINNENTNTPAPASNAVDSKFDVSNTQLKPADKASKKIVKPNTNKVTNNFGLPETPVNSPIRSKPKAPNLNKKE
ncbi:pLS20_p028 family conjugation system transmembrane protein [Latilactobacillus curvatus]|uniref:DUF8208 domain-containing protein n=2 Tax=Lactobacillaceae TaxID=33958 RepID=A0ABM7QWU2_LATCU|nr:hypothetical protein [Latilactobacillus curvatus]ASN13603.1 hypothetical protein B4V05_10250 [Latilactobacillus sakei]KGB13848.1 hypothetical protein KY41_11000 [Latilactobacillus sakei]MCW8780308.1 hypothetical protein [Latilactobacillus curvatus]UTB73276.1 hypothetical protein A4W72_10985 [Latilactobacillus curvatus]BCX31545.1 hypothetical protein LTWDN19_21120 [Latilactobacillus curvatus]